MQRKEDPPWRPYSGKSEMNLRPPKRGRKPLVEPDEEDLDSPGRKGLARITCNRSAAKQSRERKLQGEELERLRVENEFLQSILLQKEVEIVSLQEQLSHRKEEEQMQYAAARIPAPAAPPSPLPSHSAHDESMITTNYLGLPTTTNNNSPLAALGQPSSVPALGIPYPEEHPRNDVDSVMQWKYGGFGFDLHNHQCNPTNDEEIPLVFPPFSAATRPEDESLFLSPRGDNNLTSRATFNELWHQREYGESNHNNGLARNASSPPAFFSNNNTAASQFISP